MNENQTTVVESTDVKVQTPDQDTSAKADDTKDQKGDVEANKTEALRIEREKRKEAEGRLAEYAKKEQEALEKEQIKKGKFEEVINAQKTQLEQLQATVSELSTYKEKFETTMTKQIEELTTKIPEGKRDFVNKLLDGKGHDQKVEILSEFAKEFKEYSPNAQRSNASIDQGAKPTNAKDAIQGIASMFMR